MTNRDTAEVLPSLKKVVSKLENDHDSNPAAPQLREILLNRIAKIEESKKGEQNHGNDI